MTGSAEGGGLDIAGDQGGYARLPEDLLKKLLDEAPAIVNQVRALLEPALDAREQLRETAQSLDIIHHASPARGGTICAVDGGFAIERTIAVDLLLSVAVGVEGFTSDTLASVWNNNQYAHFTQVLKHTMDNERLARFAMVANELAVLADSDHDIAVYDGSHLTPVIQLNSGVSSEDTTVGHLCAEVSDDVDLVSALEQFVTAAAVIAMPKYDSSTALCGLLGGQLRGEPIGGDDKYLTSLILRGGEYTTPQRVEGSQWPQLHITPHRHTAAGSDPRIGELDRLLDPLRDRALYFLYWRPDDASPSYRIEVKPDLVADPDRLNFVLSTLSYQITGPFVREPYPQYLADVMAKSVSLGLGALQSAAHLSMTALRPDLGEVLVHSYRTSGKS